MGLVLGRNFYRSHLTPNPTKLRSPVNTVLVTIVMTGRCARGKSLDYRSYIQYECEKAVNDGLKIVVFYNASSVDKAKCPEAVKNTGTHKAMCYRSDGTLYWDYQTVKDTIG